MRYSQLFGKTSKQAPHDADSANARLLAKAGFINRVAAGVYTYLPLGLRVLRKVKKIVREEMDAIGAQEILMPALHPRRLYDSTDRWEKLDIMFKLKGSGGKEYGLSSTAEEIITPLVKAYTKSYRDFPVALYQIQDKFRDEPRAKSGLLRGREFSMKDLYSFHLDERDFMDFYEKAKDAYLKIYRRCGLKAIIAAASGGVFTDKHSHEFQVPTQAGEDKIYINKETGEAMNKEIVPESERENEEKYDIVKSIEVGNIFPLECRFSNAFNLKTPGPDGKTIDIIMGCYGIGPSRVMGSIVEVHHDDNGMIWPKSVAPYQAHLITLSAKDDETNDKIESAAANLLDELEKAGVDALWDDREGTTVGEKFADADLIGIPLRLVISRKTLVEDSVEWKERHESDARLVKLTQVSAQAKEWLAAADRLTSHG